MYNSLLSKIMCFAAILLTFGELTAQESRYHTGIRGSISDPSGAVPTGAVIRVMNTASGQKWNVSTGPDGNYSISNLPAGNYTLTIHQGGFSQIVKTVHVGEGEVSYQPLTLSVASAIQQVEVTSGFTRDGLTAREIREGSARDLGEATQNIAGVKMVRKAAIANDIAIRGLFHNNIATWSARQILYQLT